ncbi:MAG: adenylyltransferase/cytidyltransferase family protein [Prolixibacteraceae bacterium]|jgi:cytidyltransferase-like protein|nr:adenylyltransferase/cytidyltransferase family protein [Prolixibacteraceae bacterium]
MNDKKVLVSGCYDLLHAGHVAFFKTAAQYGKLYVSVGQDDNILELKGKKPYFTQDERVYMVGSIKYVYKAFVSSGRGMLDFEEDMKRIKPDIFVVNTDGFTEEKARLCKENNVVLIVLERIPEKGLPVRSSSSSKQELQFPYRVCIAGGWMDQPWVSEIHPGSVVVARIWPTIDFNDRSGMATSSRRVALELWGGKIPEGNPERNAQLLFGAENPPGSNYVSGSQDHIGLLVPGVSRLDYDGSYWPSDIENTTDKATCEWLSDVLHFVPLSPRPCGYDPLREQHLEKELIKELGSAGQECYDAIMAKNVRMLGESMTKTFYAWKKILPYTVPTWVLDEMESKYIGRYPGAITSGCGGGYAIIASEEPVEGALKIKVRY